MRILVCFQIVPDLDGVMERDWDAAALEGWDIGYAKKVISCYDEAALECALRIKDAVLAEGGEAEVDAVTIGGCGEVFYKNMFAVGIRRVLEITPPEKDLRFAPRRTAAALAPVAKGYDLVLCGRQSALGDNGVTPFALARLLGIPCLSNAASLTWRDGALHAVLERETGLLHGQAALPLAAAIGNSDSPYLRVATLREKLRVSKALPETLPWEEPEGEQRDPGPVALYRKKLQKQCRMLDGSDPAAAARELYRCWKEGLA